MVERQDIDALLISALYGELTPAEETRLAAHLESHPADRTVLADLTSARDAVRESRLLQVQLEPPQSISALLLQEAARRAPAKHDAEAGWLARFFKSFMAHPAMAAAAMLVVVIGVATMVAKRKPDMVESAEPVQSAIQERASAPNAAAGSGATTTEAGKDVATPTTAAGDLGNNVLAVGEAPGSAYRVGLADDLKAEPTEKAKEGKADAAKGAEAPTPIVVAKPAPAKAAPTKAAGPSQHDGYLELRKQDQAPMDFEEQTAKPTAKKKFATAPDRDGDAVVDETKTMTTSLDGNADKLRGAAPGGMVGGGAAASGAPAAAQPPPPPPAPRTTVAPTTPTREVKHEVKRADRAEKSAVQQAPSQSPTAAPAPTVAPGPAPAEDKPVDATTAWAQTQHKNLIAQVKAGNCQDAANLAVELSNRAPSYYQQNVANDRSVKQCLAYITAEREKQAEERAAKNRASATKRAADEPARAKAGTPAKPTTK
jgi:hypothetical protein